jgi:hypothetical protein
MPIVPFIPAIISGAGSLVGGAIASHGAKTAAQQQSARRWAPESSLQTPRPQ